MADRKITEVIQQLLEIIPDRYPHARRRLESISRDSLFRAPEIMYESWGELSEALHSMFDGEQPCVEWQIRVCEIMTTKTREELGLSVRLL